MKALYGGDTGLDIDVRALAMQMGRKVANLSIPSGRIDAGSQTYPEEFTGLVHPGPLDPHVKAFRWSLYILTLISTSSLTLILILTFNPD